MSFPSLNEMLNAIQASQQNAFIPAYQDSLRQKQEMDYKQQQMNKLMQEMQLAQDMHPVEVASKQASTRLNTSTADINELSTAKTRDMMARPA